MKHDRIYPSIDHLEAGARRRIPKFVHEFVTGGVGAETCMARNRAALDNVILRPRYLRDTVEPDLGCKLWGYRYDLPIAIAPLGLDGLVWPDAATILSRSANLHNIPYCLSSYSTTEMESLTGMDSALKWFQYYHPREREMEKDLLGRAKDAGFETLVVTVDQPAAARRPKDIRNGISVPPDINLEAFFQVVTRPAWMFATLRHGEPHFVNLMPYLPDGLKLADLSRELDRLMEIHVSPEILRRLRDAWPGLLVVKGILDPSEADLCRQIGVDGIVVSNHGGRQLDAAPSPLTVLPEIKSQAGPMAVLVDGGVRSGLDVVRMIAMGADFVLVGRAFLLGLAALGGDGGDHVTNLLRKEMRATMLQLGCPDLAGLPELLDTGEVSS